MTTIPLLMAGSDITKAYNKTNEFEHFMSKQDEVTFSTNAQLQGHPILCSSGCCGSKLRLLQAAAVHYPPLRTFLNKVYCVQRCNKFIKNIDQHLASGSVEALLMNISIQNCADLLEHGSCPQKLKEHLGKFLNITLKWNLQKLCTIFIKSRRKIQNLNL